MNALQFDQLVQIKLTQHPKWFELESDPPAPLEAIAASENRLGVRFPNEYRHFLGKYGGGYFAFGNVFSVTPGSEWNVEARNTALGFQPGRDGYISISDPGTGDYYGFSVSRGVMDPKMRVYDHEQQEWNTTSFGDLFEFLAAVALTF